MFSLNAASFELSVRRAAPATDFTRNKFPKSATLKRILVDLMIFVASTRDSSLLDEGFQAMSPKQNRTNFLFRAEDCLQLYLLALLVRVRRRRSVRRVDASGEVYVVEVVQRRPHWGGRAVVADLG